MATIESWEVLLIAIAVGWFFYKVGKSVGRQEQREWDSIKKQIDLEPDPDKKLELQLKWAESIEHPTLKSAYKSVFEARQKASKDKPSQS